MPCTAGETPVTIDELLTLVKEGRAPRAIPRYPCFAIFFKLGIRSCRSVASRYSSADPSIQITTRGFGEGVKRMPLTVKGLMRIFAIDQEIGEGPEKTISGTDSFSKYIQLFSINTQ